MPLHGAPLLLLGTALGSFVVGSLCGSPSHSLSYFYMHLSEPSQGLPQFFIRGYLDDQPIAHYDSLTGKMETLMPWVEAAENKTFLAFEWVIGTELEVLSQLSHLTKGFHTWQLVLGCELREDGSKGGFLHYGYDGMDFISFDKETLRWVIAQPQAQKVKEEWEEDPGWSERNKLFLEKTCIEGLQRYLSYQKKDPLQRTEPPVGKVTRKVVDEKLEVLTCQAFGFYPKEIQAIWRRDGKNCKYETLRRNVVPNSDGTYYIQLNIEIDPKERDRFRCHLEHEGLQEPLDLAFKEERGWLIPVGIVAGLLPGVVILFLMGWLWKRRRNNLCQEVAIFCDQAPSQRVLSSLEYDTEDEIRCPLLPKSTSEHKASYGMQRSWSDPEITASSSSLHMGEQKWYPKWKSWNIGDISSGQATLTLHRSNPPKPKDLAAPEEKNRSHLQYGSPTPTPQPTTRLGAVQSQAA